MADDLFLPTLVDEAPGRANISTGPSASFAETAAAAFWNAGVTSNLRSEETAIAEAKSERRKRIEQLTGKAYDEAIKPYRKIQQPVFSRAAGYAAKDEEEAVAALGQALNAQGKPGVFSGPALRARAIELAQERMARLDEVKTRARGWNSVIGEFIGAGGDALTDPLNVATMPIGGPGAGLLRTAVEQTLLGATATAVTDVMIKSWREELGIDTSPETIAKEAMLSGLFQGGVAGAFKGIAQGLGKIATARERAAAFDRAVEKLQVKDVPPALKEERRVLEALAAVEETKPGDVSDTQHIKQLLDADKRVIETDHKPGSAPADKPPAGAVAGTGDAGVPPVAQPPVPAPKPDFTAEAGQAMLKDLEKQKPKRPRQRPRDIVEFLQSKGGVRDDGGELKARDLNKFGRLVRKNGLSLDDAASLAEQNGYLYDAKARAGGQSAITPQDLLDIIDRNEAGDRVFPFGEDPFANFKADKEAYDANVEMIDRTLGELNDVISERMPPHIVRRAAEFMLDSEEGLDPADALERAILEDYNAADDAISAQSREASPGNEPGGSQGQRDEAPPFGEQAGPGPSGEAAGIDPGRLVDRTGGAAAEEIPDAAILRAETDAIPEPDARLKADPETDAIEAELRELIDQEDLPVLDVDEGSSLREIFEAFEQEKKLIAEAQGCLG